MKLLPIASLLLISLAACTEAADEVGPATTGIYRLTAQPFVQSCDPIDPQDQWTVTLVRTPDVLSYVTPASSPAVGSLERFETDAALRYEFESTIGGACSRGHFRHQFEVVAESPDRIEAMLDQVWSDVVRCESDPVDGLLPVGDCRTQRALTYELVEPCEAPCEVINDGSNDVCSC